MILNMMKPASLSVVASTSYVQGTRATPGLESKSKHFEKKNVKVHDSRAFYYRLGGKPTKKILKKARRERRLPPKRHS